MWNTFPGSELMVVNALGHAAGVLIFGNFLFLLVRSHSTRRAYTTTLAVTAAALAFVWNLAWLGLIARGETHSVGSQLIAAIAFSALSLLPAVLLNFTLWERFPRLARAGYLVSGVAVLAHIAEAVQESPEYHSFGLIVITAGFGFLTIIAVLTTFSSGDGDRRSVSSRLFAAMSLFLFAISLVHFREGESPRAWATELLVHHAGMPLALFVLIQDYRFVLLDAFIRFLANGLLAGLFGFGIALGLRGLSLPAQAVVAGVLLALFAVSRAATLRFLSKIVFREVNSESVLAAIQRLTSKVSREQDYIPAAFQQIAIAMSTCVIDNVPAREAPGEMLMPTLAADLPDANELHLLGVQVVVPVHQANTTTLMFLGERRSGQRYLSQDLGTLARLAAFTAQQADHIRETEIRRLASEAELRALQAQVHPHFLFNALNTLYGIIPREALEARETVLNLAEILRYFLRSERTYIPLEEELRVVRAYLTIESLRLGSKLRVAIDVEEGVSKHLIPILSVQPLVENAVKHGIASHAGGGEVRVEVRRRDSGILVTVRDSGRGFNPGVESPRHAGIGLRNVSRRLELCYGPHSRLDIRSGPDGASVGFWAPCAGDAEGVRSPPESARR